MGKSNRLKIVRGILCEFRFILKKRQFFNRLSQRSSERCLSTVVYLDKNEEVVRSTLFRTDDRGAPYANFLKTMCGIEYTRFVITSYTCSHDYASNVGYENRPKISTFEKGCL